MLTRDSGGNQIRLGGTHPLGGGIQDLSVALEDPARYAATAMAEVLESKGIRVAGSAATSSEPLPPGARVLASHPSPPMAEIVKGTNKPSLNLHAEMLLRLLGYRLRGEGSAQAGRDAVRDFLRKIGVTPQAWSLDDGSGLSPSDLVTAHDVAAFLAAMNRHPQAHAFRDSLPVAGVDGTLKGRFKGTRAEGRIVAKTGTLRQTSALAGYGATRGGEPFAFAIFLNHYTVPSSEAIAAIDAICLALVED